MLIQLIVLQNFFQSLKTIHWHYQAKQMYICSTFLLYITLNAKKFTYIHMVKWIMDGFSLVIQINAWPTCNKPGILRKYTGWSKSIAHDWKFKIQVKSL